MSVPGFVSCSFRQEQRIDINVNAKHWSSDNDKEEKEALGENPVQVPLCPTQISHVLTLD